MLFFCPFCKHPLQAPPDHMPTQCPSTYDALSKIRPNPVTISCIFHSLHCPFSDTAVNFQNGPHSIQRGRATIKLIPEENIRGGRWCQCEDISWGQHVWKGRPLTPLLSSSTAAGKSHTSCCGIDISQVVCRPWRRMEGGEVLCEVLQCAEGDNVETPGFKQERPYNHDSTASRLLSEVKHDLARLVLRWGTTLEYLVLFFLHFTSILNASTTTCRSSTAAWWCQWCCAPIFFSSLP